MLRFSPILVNRFAYYAAASFKIGAPVSVINSIVA